LSQGIPQSAVAAKVKTTQRRVSLMENADKSISLDRLFVANFALGMKPSDLLKQMSDNLPETYIDHRPKRQAPNRNRAKIIV
jgi:transcriptional regulator with XRE-family HTH domain